MADPVRAKALMPAFEEKDVATGNLKDPEKIREKIAQKRAEHQAGWNENAALRPETGKILAIGILPLKAEPIILHVRQSDERDIIQTFWEFMVTTEQATLRPFAGWSIFHFDLPYLTIRSRILGLPVPPHIRQGRYFNATRFCDLQDEWLMGRPRSEVKCSLDYVAKALNCGQKTGDGKDFGALYVADEKAALAYLENDLKIAQNIAGKLGLLS